MGGNIHSHFVYGGDPILEAIPIFSKNKVLHVSINHIRKRTVQVKSMCEWEYLIQKKEYAYV